MVVSNTEPSTHSSFLHSYKNTQGQLVKSTNNLWMRFPYWENFSFCWQSPSTNNERTAVTLKIQLNLLTSLKEREFHKMQSLSQWTLRVYIQIYRKKRVSRPYAMHMTHSTRQRPLYQHTILEKCWDLYYKRTLSTSIEKTFSRPMVQLWALKQQSLLLIFSWLRLRQQLSISKVQSRWCGKDISMTCFPSLLAEVSHGVLTKCEPASHASHASHHVSHASHHVNHARQMLVHSPFSFLRLLAAFGYLARVFAILALLAISFCYLPLSFSSFVKVSYVFVLLSLNFFIYYSFLSISNDIAFGSRFNVKTETWRLESFDLIPLVLLEISFVSIHSLI